MGRHPAPERSLTAPESTRLNLWFLAPDALVRGVLGIAATEQLGAYVARLADLVKRRNGGFIAHYQARRFNFL
jgi:hypothetical protein